MRAPPRSAATLVGAQARRRLRRFVPDALLDAARSAGLLGGREWQHEPGAWATPAISEGWADPSIVRAEVAKWPAFLAAVAGPGTLGVNHEASVLAADDLSVHNTVMSFAYVLGRARVDPLRVLDWGGGLGHYYVFARRLWPETELRWTCRDLPAICREGARLQPEVEFTSDDGCLGRRYDLVVALSSIHYTRDWAALLAALAAAADPWLYLGRVPVTPSAPTFPVVQSPHRYGYETRYVGWFLNRHELLRTADAAGLELDREFLEGERPYVRNAPERAAYHGFLFRRRAEASSRDGDGAAPLQSPGARP